MASEDQNSSPPADLASSPPTVEQTSRLLMLPDEILETILDFAYASALPSDDPHAPTEYGLALAHKPVCRRLRPIQQGLLYRQIKITTYDQLGNIARALTGDHRLDEPRPGTLVRALVLDAWADKAWRGPGGMGDEIGPGVPELAANCLAQLFSELGQLQSLDFSITHDSHSSSSPVERALLAVLVQDPNTPVNLRGLKSLVLHTNGMAVVEGPEGEADDIAAWMDQFGQFAELTNLDIYLGSAQLSSFIQGESQGGQVLAKLSRLAIDANFARWVKPLRNVAPHLVDLELCATSRSLRPLILGSPPSLRRLSILSSGEPVESVDDLLPPLFLLQHLTLDIMCYEPARLSNSLGHLQQLESLTFGFGCEVSERLLLALVDGPTRLERLRSLQINVVQASRGPTLLRKELILPDEHERDQSGLWRGWCGWYASAWPAGLSEAGLGHVVDVARGRGIRVSGGAISSLGWRAAFERERDVVAVCRGLSTGDWSFARRFLNNGDERVDAFLARRRREGRRRSLGRELSLL
ncbi:hypothetical protein JCM9279_001117 [Rhodotorula babjevae]